MPRRRACRTVLYRLCSVLILMPALAACTVPGTGTRYLPAGTSTDPYHAVRARAEALYEAGVNQERQGNWRKALNDYQQARLWDPDNRRDIQSALVRAQTRVDAQAGVAPTASAVPPTPAPRGAGKPTPSARQASTPTPTAATVAAGMREFQSLNFPYVMAYPGGWLAKQGGTGQQPIDTFVGQPAPDISAVVMVTVDVIDSGTTLDEVSAATTRDLRSQGINDVQVAEQRQVAGLPAYVLAYGVKTDAGRAAARNAVFVTPGSAWHVVLLATPGTTPGLVKTFDAMLDSFRLLPAAFPVASTPRTGGSIRFRG